MRRAILRQEKRVSLPVSNKAISACDGIFRKRLRGADGDQLIAGRLSTAVPGLAEERNACPGSSRTADFWSGPSGRGVSGLPDAFERYRPRFLLLFCSGGDILHGFAESVQAGIGVFPGISQ